VQHLGFTLNLKDGLLQIPQEKLKFFEKELKKSSKQVGSFSSKGGFGFGGFKEFSIGISGTKVFYRHDVGLCEKTKASRLGFLPSPPKGFEEGNEQCREFNEKVERKDLFGPSAGSSFTFGQFGSNVGRGGFGHPKPRARVLAKTRSFAYHRKGVKCCSANGSISSLPRGSGRTRSGQHGGLLLPPKGGDVFPTSTG